MRFSELHPNIKVRIFVGFVQRVINNMFIPFMAIYFSKCFGPVLAGTLIMVTIFLGFISNFVGGYLVDRYGRKRILFIGEFINAVAIVGIAFCNIPLYHFPWGTYVFYLANQIISNINTPAVEAMIVDVSTPKTRKFVYGINYWAINLSLAIGALIGGVLYYTHFFYTVLTAAIVTLIISLTYLFFTKETLPQKDGENNKLQVASQKFFKSYRPIFVDTLFLKLVVASLLFMTLEYQLTYYISVKLTEQFPISNLLFLGKTTGVEVYSILRVENTLSVVLFAFIIEKLFKSMQDKQRLIVGLTLYTIGISIVGYSLSFWILFLFTFVFTIGELLYVPIKQSLLADIVKDDSRSKYMAVNNLHYRGGQMMASLFLSLGALLSPALVALSFLLIGICTLVLFLSILKSSAREVSSNEYYNGRI